jgi:mycothiol synthase
MPDFLPDGYTWRRAVPGDAELIFNLISGYNTEVIGHADVTLNDMRDDLTEPGFDLATDSWLVFDPGGSLAGFAWAIGKGSGQEVDVDVRTRVPALNPWMYDQVLARAAELARAGGHAQCLVDMGVYRDDTRARAAAEQRGFTASTVFYRMRTDHGPDPQRPVPPADLTLHSGPGDEDFRRLAHELLAETFKDHYGFFAQPYEEWRQAREQELTFDWSQLTVAELAGRPVAVMVTSDRYVEDENCGYVQDLGVLAEARGRGIAKYLLRTAFATDVSAGRTGTILHVDANNTTPALGLYEGVGMRPVLVIDILRRQLSTERTGE